MQHDTYTNTASWLSYTCFGPMSISTAQVCAFCYMWRLPHLYSVFPRRTLPECWTESLFSAHLEQLLSLLSDHTMQSPFILDTQQEAFAMWRFPHSKYSETVMMMVTIVRTAVPLFMASPHSLSGLHCSATFIKSH